MTHSGRPLAVAVTATALAGGLLGLLLPAAVPSGPGFAPLLEAGCAVVGALGTVWLWVLTLLVVHDVLRGRSARGGVPRTVRRVVLAACGLSLVGGLAAPAHADPGERSARPAAEVLAGLPLPDRTTTTTQWLGSFTADRRTPVGRTPRAGEVGSVRVAPGDTLWELAARDLGGDASAADVGRHWRRIYELNREVVGADPHLIRPGQRLVLPGTTDDTAGRS